MPRRMSRLGPYRALYASLWEHPDFRALSVRARLLLLALRTGPLAGLACIFRYHIEDLADLTGLSRRAVAVALRELAEIPSPARPWIRYDDRLVWVRNALQFDPSVSVLNANHAIAIRNCIVSLPSESKIVRAFLDYYPEIAEVERVISPTSGDTPSPTPADAHRGMPSAITDPGTRYQVPDPEPGPEQSAAGAAASGAATTLTGIARRAPSGWPLGVNEREANRLAASLRPDHPDMPVENFRELVVRHLAASSR